MISDTHYEQVLDLAKHLPIVQKEQLISVLQKSIYESKSNKGKRALGKYQGKIKIADDFDEALEDFTDYMK